MPDSTYTKDGVNVAQGDALSAVAAAITSGTWGLSRFVHVKDRSEGHFRGARTVQFVRLEKAGPLMLVASDGIGTKTGIHVAAHTPQQAAHDMVAMITTDILRYGGMPCIMSNVLELRTTGKPGSREEGFAKKLMEGLGVAARMADIAVVGGETAEVGRYIGWDDPESTIAFGWSGTAIGLVTEERIIDGSRLRPDQPVVALRELGFRSNGISSVRAAFEKKFGRHWWRATDAQEPLQQAARPSILYDRPMKEALGWERKTPINISAIAHISGGGIRDKFGEDLLFRYGLSATLDNLFPPPPIMELCAQWRGIPDVERYGTWNGGQGMLVVLESREGLEQFLTLSEAHGIDAVPCGTIGEKSDDPKLVINSKYDDGGEVVYTKQNT